MISSARRVCLISPSVTLIRGASAVTVTVSASAGASVKSCTVVWFSSTRTFWRSALPKPESSACTL